MAACWCVRPACCRGDEGAVRAPRRLLPWNFPIGNPARKSRRDRRRLFRSSSKAAGERPGSALACSTASSMRGWPKEVASCVFGVPRPGVQAPAGIPIIRKVSFTGLVAVGKHLMKLAAEGAKRTTMELRSGRC